MGLLQCIKNDHAMPFLNHISEIRSRCIILFMLYIAFFITIYYNLRIFLKYITLFLNPEKFHSITILRFLPQFFSRYWENNILNFENVPLLSTGVTEMFWLEVSVAHNIAIILLIPFVMLNIYRFCAPGLKKNEKFSGILMILFSNVLAILGGLFSYFVVISAAMRFFIFDYIGKNYDGVKILIEIQISKYIAFVVNILFGFALAFQLPLLIVIFYHCNIINIKILRKYRRHSVVAIFIISAILTPPDVLSQIMLALPLIVLYEISIISCLIMGHRRSKMQNSEKNK